MKNVKKNSIGKIGKVALCGAIALSGISSVIGYNSYNNFDIVKAYEKNDNVYTLHAEDYDEDEGTTWSEEINGTFPVGFYTAVVNYKSDVKIGDVGPLYVDYDMKQMKANKVSANGNSVTFNFELKEPASKLDFFDSGVKYSNGSIYGDYCFDTIVLTTPSLDTMAPALETQVFLTDVDSPMSLEYILSQVKFVDEVDGDIEEVVVSDNYSSNMNKVGKWTIEVKATDNAGNTGTGTIQVWVQDKTSPIINGKTTYISNMSSPITREYIESQLSVSDNVDENVELILVSDNFTGKENIVGEKTLVYRATDSAGNTSIDYTIIVNCVDDIKPTIIGESNYTTSYKVAIDVNTIKSSLTLNDNISSNLELELVSDNYTGNQSIPGTYFIKYRTTDTAGNISDVFTITIVVNDKIPPVFYTSGLFIGVSQAETLSHQEIVNLLLAMNGLENSNMGVSLLSLDGYEVDSINSPMSYSIRYQLVNEDGTNYGEELTATINVLGEEEVKENDTEVQVEQRVNKIKEFFKEVWNGIKNIGEFFVKLFKTIAFGWLWDKDGKFDPKWTEWH